MSNQANRRAIFLTEMGVGPLWVRRGTVAVSDSTHAGAFSISAEPTAAEIAAIDSAQLMAAVANCSKCDLCHGRTRTVFGSGDEHAKWLFVGGAPGIEEDAVGDAFVGPEGTLLDNMMLALGLRRGENVYLANVVKCRAIDADGRDGAPTTTQTATCLPYLERQIALMQPSIIVALGQTAALALLPPASADSASGLRGKVHRYHDIPLVVTHHPSDLLLRPADKRGAWADLCLAMSTYADISQ